MIRPIALPAIFALTACADLPVVPDFRDTASVAPVATTPAAVPAPTLQLSDKERFIAAIEANGCIINISTIGPILAQASINQDQLAALTVELENDGALSPDGTDTVRLSSANCI